MTYATEVVNLVPYGTGVRLVCEFCGRLSGRRVSGGLADLPNGWSMIPFRASYGRADGSMGASYRCPPCTDRRDFPITPREYMRPCAIGAGGRCATHPGGCPPHADRADAPREDEPSLPTAPTDHPRAYTPAHPGPVVDGVRWLRKACPGTVVMTGQGLVYVKTIPGAWRSPRSRAVPASWLLDPEHSAQPIRVLYVPVPLSEPGAEDNYDYRGASSFDRVCRSDVTSGSMSDQNPPGTVPIVTAADQLGVTRRTAERYVASGRLTAVRAHTGRVYVTLDSIQALLKPVPVGQAPALAEGGEQS